MTKRKKVCSWAKTPARNAARPRKATPLFNPITGWTPSKRQGAKEAALAKLAEWDSRSADLQARLTARPRGLKNEFSLPQEVAEFLWQLHEPMSMAVRFGLWHELLSLLGSKSHANQSEAEGMLSAVYEYAYAEGCRQGYIEGFVARRAPDISRSKKANAGKRKKVVVVDGEAITLDERDARMQAEYAELVQLMRPTPAKQRLAEKYGFESWQGVNKALEALPKRSRE